VPEAIGPPLSPGVGVGVGCGLGLGVGFGLGVGVALLGLGLAVGLGLRLGLGVGVGPAWWTVSDPEDSTWRSPVAETAIKVMACQPTETTTDALKLAPWA
jgi:hypothetical protein